MEIVVTGMGIVSPLGHTVEGVWGHLLQGKSAVKPLEGLELADLPVKIAAQIRGFNFLDYLDDAKRDRQLAKFIKYGYAASKMAMQSAGLLDENCQVPKEEIGAILGSGMGGIEIFEENVLKAATKSPKKVSPFFIPMSITNMLAGFTALEFGLGGPNFSISTACATANHALIDAASILKRGDAKVMLAGGAESALNLPGISGFCAQKALSLRNDDPEKASRPFDVNRDGFVMGEGAAVLVLETLEHAMARGAKIYARYLGGGMTCDAYHITAPDPEGTGAARAMQMALKNAGLQPEKIGYINAHGTSTPLGDVAEIKAIHRVFGEFASKLKISATKSMMGHGLGAAAGFEAIAVICSLMDQKIHPTINVENQDPLCDLDVVPNQAIDFSFDFAMSNSFGFGGHNSCVIFGRH